LRQYGVELLDLEGKFVGPFEATKRLSEALNKVTLHLFVLPKSLVDSDKLAKLSHFFNSSKLRKKHTVLHRRVQIL
jgi:hypothetical protein